MLELKVSRVAQSRNPECSDFPLYFDMVTGCFNWNNQAVSGFSFVFKFNAVSVIKIIGIKQFFNFSFDLCKLNLIGDQFRICFFLFVVSDLKVLKPCPHGIENKLLLFSLVDFTTSLTAPPSVLYSGNIPDCFALGYFQSISATPHLTFPANHIFFGLQPCAGRSYLSLVSFCISARRHMSASCGTITSI